MKTETDYKKWLTELKSTIRQSQIKAAVKVNTELLILYWNMGQDIVSKQLEAKYGSGFFEQLSKDLREEFPDMKGFSTSNLYYIKQFYEFYSPSLSNFQQVAGKLHLIENKDDTNFQQVAGKLNHIENKSDTNLQQVVEDSCQQVAGNLPQVVEELHSIENKSDTNRHQVGDEILQQPAAEFHPIENKGDIILHQVGEDFRNHPIFQIPWFHHVQIFTKCKSIKQAMFYIQKTIENGWSRAVLMNFMEADLYAAQGNAQTNFSRLLPEPQSDLANQILKDPYNFDFLTLTDNYKEKELEDALTTNITRFLLELGQGFAYLGRQIAVKIGEKERFLDLLFYHLDLRCYVVIELKATDFEAEYIGKLGLYTTAINHQRKKETDNPTIGMLICRTKDNIEVQYSLESTNQPIGVSEYQLTKLLPDDLKSSLPSIEELEKQLNENGTFF